MKYSPFLFVLAIISVMVLSGGCKKNKDNSTDFVVFVDSLHVADTISYGDTLEIEFFGEIGPNGCYTLKDINGAFSGDSLLITVIGHFSGEDVCPDVLVVLDGTILQVTNLIPGDYVIDVKQPDETDLIKKVHVSGPSS